MLGNSRQIRKAVLKAATEELKKQLGTDRTPAIGLCFTLPPEYQECHFITNVSREDGIKLFKNTAARMDAQRN